GAERAPKAAREKSWTARRPQQAMVRRLLRPAPRHQPLPQGPAGAGEGRNRQRRLVLQQAPRVDGEEQLRLLPSALLLQLRPRLASVEAPAGVVVARDVRHPPPRQQPPGGALRLVAVTPQQRAAVDL